MFGLSLVQVKDDELEKMSDAALASLEDRLLLESELDTSPRARFSAGKAVVYLLSAIGIAVGLSLMSLLPTQKLGPINIPIYLGALFLGIIGGHWVWSVAGQPVRTGIRWLLGHWPIVLYLTAMGYSLVR
jgi:Na+/glutamate symporter